MNKKSKPGLAPPFHPLVMFGLAFRLAPAIKSESCTANKDEKEK